MAAATRDFDAERTDRPAEGPTFKLGGDWYHCIPILPFPTLQSLAEVGLASGDANAIGMQTIASLPSLFDAVIVDDELDRWHTFLADKTSCPDTTELAEIAKWLISAYVGGRPTQPPSDSPDGPESGSTTSTDDSSSPDAPAEPTA